MSQEPVTNQSSVTPPAIVRSLEKWHAMVAAQDLSGLPELLHPEAVFRSPVAHTPYPGAPVMAMILVTVVKVFQNFRYHRLFASDDGLSHVLEFSAEVNGKQLKGIDMVRFDPQGRITEFEVMVRPASGLQALGEEMGRRLGGLLAAGKNA